MAKKRTKIQKAIAKEIRHFKGKKKGHVSKKQAIAIAFSKTRRGK